eukprot:748064-Hanusia_phi.AAC.4
MSLPHRNGCPRWLADPVSFSTPPCPLSISLSLTWFPPLPVPYHTLLFAPLPPPLALPPISTPLCRCWQHKLIPQEKPGDHMRPGGARARAPGCPGPAWQPTDRKQLGSSLYQSLSARRAFKYYRTNSDSKLRKRARTDHCLIQPGKSLKPDDHAARNDIEPTAAAV